MEYYTQCDKEKEEGLPISPFMDRDVTTKVTSQLKFIKDMLIPIFGLMTKVRLEVILVAVHRDQTTSSSIAIATANFRITAFLWSFFKEQNCLLYTCTITIYVPWPYTAFTKCMFSLPTQNLIPVTTTP